MLEAALVIPLMIAILLAILQLTEIEHARTMTEFAAFSAARAGIVHNGSNARMRDAALVALLPTFGRTDSAEALLRTWQRQRAADEELAALPWSTAAPSAINGSPLKGLVRIDTLAPEGSDELGRVWNLRGGHGWAELDFDAAYTYPEAPGLEQQFEAFGDPAKSDAGQEVYRRANLLRIRVRHWYELRVPVANWILFVCWYASHARIELRGAIDRPTVDSSANALNRSADLGGIDRLAAPIENRRGFPTADRSDLALLWALAQGESSAGPGSRRRFFIPLAATHTIRMQSNFYRKWLMHDRGG